MKCIPAEAGKFIRFGKVMSFWRKTILVASILFFCAGCGVKNQDIISKNQTGTPEPSANEKSSAILKQPVSNALSRITKKTFGLYVTPKNSPVSPEKFTGYHTGVDFEILPGEENTDVSVSAVCSGKILLKKWASGYGGVLVEACKIENQDVTVVYGHLKLDSISAKAGESLEPGQSFAVLGKGFSTETDGERKHLHLGLHKGTSINIKGYVQTKEELVNLLDAHELLK
jgi:hypothetical protein